MRVCIRVIVLLEILHEAAPQRAVGPKAEEHDAADEREDGVEFVLVQQDMCDGEMDGVGHEGEEGAEEEGGPTFCVLAVPADGRVVGGE